MSRITLKSFPVTPQTLLTTENLCFKQKSNFYEKMLPPTMMVRMEIIQAIGLISAAGISVTVPDMVQELMFWNWGISFNLSFFPVCTSVQ